MSAVDGYGSASYGDAFADVYDEWYHDVSDVDATVRLVAAAAERAGSTDVLELGVGTGRLALPLAATGLRVVGVDSSKAMTDRLAERDPHGTAGVGVVVGDMVDDLPSGPFGVVLIAYNTIFNLESATRQQRLFDEVATRLVDGGSFVVEAFVPEEPPQHGSGVEVRSMAVDRVVLSAIVHHPDSQRAEGQFIELTEHGGVRLRPWSIRYAPPPELDAMAAKAGLVLRDRWLDASLAPYDDDSDRHVSVYARER